MILRVDRKYGGPDFFFFGPFSIFFPRTESVQPYPEHLWILEGFMLHTSKAVMSKLFQIKKFNGARSIILASEQIFHPWLLDMHAPRIFLKILLSKRALVSWSN